MTEMTKGGGAAPTSPNVERRESLTDTSLRREVNELKTQLKEVEKRSEREIKALNQEVGLGHFIPSAFRLLIGLPLTGFGARELGGEQDLRRRRARHRTGEVQVTRRQVHRSRLVLVIAATGEWDIDCARRRRRLLRDVWTTRSRTRRLPHLWVDLFLAEPDLTLMLSLPNSRWLSSLSHQGQSSWRLTHALRS